MMTGSLVQWILGIMILLSSLGVVFFQTPVYSALSFLGTLLALSILYMQLAAQFIAVMQILVYAGAILVIFMFVMILFQDAYQEINLFPPQSNPLLLSIAITVLFLTLVFLGDRLAALIPGRNKLPEGFGTVQSLGRSLYLDFFFPSEAVVMLFLVAIIGALYIGKRVK